MALPIFPIGYVRPLRKVFFGMITDQPRGLIDSDGEDIEAFFYVHSIDKMLAAAEVDEFTPFNAKTYEGEWLIRFVSEGINIDAPILFEQRVKIAVVILSSFGFAATWYFKYEPKITTAIINGEAVEPSEAWKYVDKPILSEFSEQSTFINIAPSSSFFLVNVAADYVSAPYKCRLPVGSYLDARQDYWGKPVNDNLSWSLSFRTGEALVDSCFDGFGGLVHVRREGTRCIVGLSYEPYVGVEHRAVFEDVLGASVNVDRYDRIWLLVKEEDGWFEYSSLYGGRLYERQSAKVWPEGMSMARSLLLDDDRRASIAKSGNDVYFKWQSDVEDITVSVGTLDKAQALTLKERNGKLFVVGETGVLFVSLNGGRNWKPRGETAAGIASEDL